MKQLGNLTLDLNGKPTDLRQPGAIDALMSFHRQTFGGWHMETDPAPDPAPDPTPDPAPDPDPDPDLGDAGKKALQAERDRAKKAERENKELRAQLDKLQGTPPQPADPANPDQAIEAAREEGRREAAAAANRAVIAAETRALAATAKMRDPRDAVIQLSTELKDITVDDNGDIDSKAIEQLLDDLKTKKPYLFDDGTSTVSHTDAGIGTGGDSGTPDPGPGRNRLAAAYGAKS